MNAYTLALIVFH